MKRLIIKTLIFTFPFISIYYINMLFWKKDGDLIRLGYIYNNPSPKSIVNENFKLDKRYTNLSELDLNEKHQFQLIVIGDSFSDQGDFGYQNYMANQGISVLNFDRELMEKNQIQELIKLINGDFFDYIKTEYVVLQVVERSFILRTENLDFNTHKKLNSLQKSSHGEIEISDEKAEFFSSVQVKAPITNIEYNFVDKPFFSKTYKTTTNTNNLFTGNPKSLLFYQDDLIIPDKNDLNKANNANEMINKIAAKLKEKGIKLILLVAPDKYDVYYEYIKNKKNYIKPLFFEFYSKQEKEYNYIDSFTILTKLTKKQKDVYFYSDTHWSPHAAKAIGTEIVKEITK